MTGATEPRRIGRPPKCGGCGECDRCKRAAYMRQWYADKTPEERRKMRERRNLDLVRERDRARYHNDPKRRKDVAARASVWRDRHPEAARAHNAVHNAIRDGKLERGTKCDQADESCCGPLSAHHDDYAKPLEVRWLCRSHHSRYHAEHGSVAEGLAA